MQLRVGLTSYCECGLGKARSSKQRGDMRGHAYIYTHIHAYIHIRAHLQLGSHGGYDVGFLSCSCFLAEETARRRRVSLAHRCIGMIDGIDRASRSSQSLMLGVTGPHGLPKTMTSQPHCTTNQRCHLVSDESVTDGVKATIAISDPSRDAFSIMVIGVADVRLRNAFSAPSLWLCTPCHCLVQSGSLCGLRLWEVSLVAPCPIQ